MTNYELITRRREEMEITKELIEAVKAANDIVELIESKNIQLKKRGKNLVCLCPFHAEKDPSFTVTPTKQMYNCFGCASNGNGTSNGKSGGDVIGFECNYEKIGFPEAVKRLAERGGVDLSNFTTVIVQSPPNF